MTDITERAEAVREQLAFTDLLDGELDLANEVIDALIAEVRRLRAAIAETDRIHRPIEWHLYATRDCPAEECDPGDEEHQPSGCCITATYTVCVECVDNWREGIGDWLDVADDVPPDEVQWPCQTHRALHPEADQ